MSLSTSPRVSKTLTYADRCPPEPAGSGEPTFQGFIFKTLQIFGKRFEPAPEKRSFRVKNTLFGLDNALLDLIRPKSDGVIHVPNAL